jgi:glycosyltransferase involved in cell wall biosynthesis
MNVIAVIPVKDEEQTIGTVVTMVKEHINEVIVVDDGSVDDTRRCAKEAGATLVSHTLNRGVGAALRTGYRIALEKNPDMILQIDGDFQHDPRYIPLLLEEASKGYDMVIGSRFLNPSHKKYNLTRRSGIKFFSWIASFLSTLEITDVTSGYRCYRASTLNQLSPPTDQHWALEQTLEAGRKGFKIKEISVDMPLRQKGLSQFNLKTYMLYPLRMIECVCKVLLFR